MKIKKLLAFSILATLMLTSCGVNSTPVKNNKTEIVYDTTTIQASVMNLIQTGEKDSSFTEEFSFDTEDMLSVIESCKNYYSQGAYYIQTSTYMYRFQLSEDGKIESYIKYNLEA